MCVNFKTHTVELGRLKFKYKLGLVSPWCRTFARVVTKSYILIKSISTIQIKCKVHFSYYLQFKDNNGILRNLTHVFLYVIK